MPHLYLFPDIILIVDGVDFSIYTFDENQIIIRVGCLSQIE